MIMIPCGPVEFFSAMIGLGIGMFLLYIHAKDEERRLRIKEREDRSARGLS
jgi:hypothetical protein